MTEALLENVLGGCPLIYHLSSHRDWGSVSEVPYAEFEVAEPFHARVRCHGESFTATCLWVGEDLHVTRTATGKTTVFRGAVLTLLEFSNGSDENVTLTGNDRRWE